MNQENNNPLNVNSNNLLQVYQQKVSDLEFQTAIKDQQIANYQVKVNDLEKELDKLNNNTDKTQDKAKKK